MSSSTGHHPGIIGSLQRAELIIDEVLYWQTRGSGLFHPGGSTDHHTAAANNGSVQSSLGIIINGRGTPGSKDYLPGPLANTHGPREESYRINLVAAGRANHAGVGHWRDLIGNSDVWGHEEEHSGTADEPMSELRIDRMARVHAAFADYSGFDPLTYQMQHYEWATPPGRKIDFIRAHLDPDRFRLRVADRLRIMQSGPQPKPPPPVQEDDMERSLHCLNADGREQLFWLDANGHLFTVWQGDDSAWSGALGLGGGYVWSSLTSASLSGKFSPGRIEVYGLSAFKSPAVIHQVEPNGDWIDSPVNLG